MTTDVIRLRRAFEEFYHWKELGKRTQDTMRLAIGAWERFTEDPDIRQISNLTLEQFRTAALAGGLAPRTVNGYWTTLRSILRKMGPQEYGNPWGLGIIPRVPAMRLCQVPFKRPRRLSMEELDKIYIACRHMQLPARRIVDPAGWWQCLLVFTYFTALRSADIFKAKWSDLDLKNQTLFVKLNKTGVEADLPLHPVLVNHLERLRKTSDSELIFSLARYWIYEKLLQQLREHAGVQFGLHDLRRTACSEIDAVAPGMGKVMLLHAPTNVTERSYLNALPELRPAIEKMASPLTFRHGIKQASRMLQEVRKQILVPTDFVVPVNPPREAFQFAPHGVVIAERMVALQPGALKVVRALVENDCVASVEMLLDVLGKSQHHTPEQQKWSIKTHVRTARKNLRNQLHLPKGFNPIAARFFPHKRCNPGSTIIEKYELILPPELWRKLEDKKAS